MPWMGQLSLILSDLRIGMVPGEIKRIKLFGFLRSRRSQFANTPDGAPVRAQDMAVVDLAGLHQPHAEQRLDIRDTGSCRRR